MPEMLDYRLSQQRLIILGVRDIYRKGRCCGSIAVHRGRVPSNQPVLRPIKVSVLSSLFATSLLIAMASNHPEMEETIHDIVQAITDTITWAVEAQLTPMAQRLDRLKDRFLEIDDQLVRLEERTQSYEREARMAHRMYQEQLHLVEMHHRQHQQKLLRRKNNNSRI
ncbi:hypothetical protein EV127DRAFT_413911 [Xylaria flabelliformis]|nr:hypothetical protein EV127DRAFT_413911 [Xylaria flabelliformis]